MQTVRLRLHKARNAKRYRLETSSHILTNKFRIVSNVTSQIWGEHAVDILTDSPIPTQEGIVRIDLAKNLVCLYAVDQRLYALREVTR